VSSLSLIFHADNVVSSAGVTADLELLLRFIPPRLTPAMLKFCTRSKGFESPKVTKCTRTIRVRKVISALDATGIGAQVSFVGHFYYLGPSLLRQESAPS